MTLSCLMVPSDDQPRLQTAVLLKRGGITVRLDRAAGPFCLVRSPIALAHLTRRIARVDGTNVKTAPASRAGGGPARPPAPACARAGRCASGVNPPTRLPFANDATTRRVARHTGPLLERIRRSRALSWDLRTLFGLSGLYEAAGQHEFAWLGAYEYLREVLGLRSETEPLRGLMQLAKNLGWMQPHQHTCWLVERPNLRAATPAPPAQCEPLCDIPTTGVWAWKDVEVPSWMIEQPEGLRLTPSIVSRTFSPPLHDRDHDPQRYVALGGPIHVAEDESGSVAQGLTHSTPGRGRGRQRDPEPDGTRKHFFLQVPAHMRTAREAVAWTYGMSEHAYSRLIVRT